MQTLRHAGEALAHIPNGANLIVSSINGEPSELLGAIDRHGPHATVHQMHPLVERDYMRDQRHPTHYRSLFLSGADRPHGVDYVPSNFSMLPAMLRRLTWPVVLTTATERHGRLFWGTNAEYVAALVRDGVPAIVEVNEAMPAVQPAPELERAAVAKFYVNRPPTEFPTPEPTPDEDKIARYVASRIPDGATLQVGIGAVPNMVLRYLRNRVNLRVWTELLTDGVVDLAEAGALDRHAPIVATLVAGTSRLYRFTDGNPRVELRPCDEVIDPRAVAQHDDMVSVCAATEVDHYGQVAAETIAGRYYSGTGGQLDFQIGAAMSKGGQGFIVLPSTAKRGTLSRIVPTLTPGSVVTTPSQYVHNVVTEWGVANLRGRTLRERKAALVAITHPAHREA